MKKLLAFFAVVIPIIAVLIIVLTSSIVGHTVDIPVESITLHSEAGVVNVNSSLKMEYDIYPKQAHNQQVIFKSSNENIAVVDQDGNVTFVGFGNVLITVTTVDGNKSQSANFSVESKNAVGINLTTNKSEIVLDDNPTAILTSTIFPSSAINKEIAYSSSDESVATVNKNGVVTALSPGEVTITATTYGDISQHITLYVTRLATSLTLLANNQTENYISESEFVDLTPSYLPVDTSSKYKNTQYFSSDKNVATVNANGKVIFKTNGCVEITAKNVQGLTDTITLFYTGGLPSSFECNFESPYHYHYNEQDLSKNNGKIDITFPPSTSNTNVRFSSSNPNVVSVDNYGNYTINGGGESIITIKVQVATVENDKLVIKDETKTIPFKITRDATDISIQQNITTSKTTYQINASVLPADATNKIVTYQSLNDVASVDSNGLVSFIKPGQAEILLSVAVSNGTINKNIKIISSFNYPTSVDIQIDELIKNNSTTHIEIEHYPTSATQLIGYWDVQDSAILQILDNKLTTLKTGKTSITYNYKKWDNTLLQLVDDKITKEITVYDSIEVVNLLPIGLEQNYDNIFYTALPQVDLNYSYEPSGAKCDIQFKSSDQTVATVLPNGKAYFKKQGTCTFTLTCTDLAGVKIDKAVTITYTNQNPISATLSCSKTELWPNQSAIIEIVDIKPTNCTSPYYTLTEDNNLLNINGNTITAIKAGKTTLTATFSNGIKLFKEITIYQPIENITLCVDSPLTASKVVTLSQTILPSNAKDKGITFTSSDDTIATVSSLGVVTFLKAGVVKITATANDKQGATTSITIESTFGTIKEISMNQKIVQGNVLPFEIIPNDFSGDINVELVSQTPVGATTENVISIDAKNKQIYAVWPGTARLKFTSTNFTKLSDIEVIKATGEILSFDIDDQIIYEGQSVQLAVKNITTSFDNPDVEQLYIKYLNISYTPNSANITIKNNTLTSNCYGLYTVTAKINGLEKTFNVTVLLPSEYITFEALSVDNIKANKYLSYDIDKNILSGTANFNIGTASVINHLATSNSQITFEYITSDSNIATVDSIGNVVFKKEGIVDVLVSQTLTLNASSYTETSFQKITTLKYVKDTISYTTSYNMAELSQETPTVVEYSPNGTIELLHTNFVPKNPNYVALYEIIDEIPNVQDGNVLDIVDGKPTILGGGQATIKVTIGNKSYQYKFIVLRKVNSISLGSDISTHKSIIDLSYSILPTDASNKTITFSVDDTTVCDISNTGRLTFKKAGTVVVLAKSNDGSNVQTSINVTSTFGGISDFNLTSTNITINKNESFSIINDLITVSPNEVAKPSNFTFKILSQTVNNGQSGQVVSLSDSIVTGLCGGNVCVEISIYNAFGKLLTKTLTVTVTESVENIIITPPDICDIDSLNNFITSKDTISLNASISPTTADNINIIWQSSDLNIATVENGKVTFINSGIVTIKALSQENSTIYEEVSFRYTKDSAYSASISEIPATMTVGDTLTVLANNVIPTDLSTYTYKINILQSKINNNATGDVVEINNNKITALNGGTVTIEVIVSNFKVGEYTITVKCPATSITLSKNNVVFEDYYPQTRTYQIDASILPVSTHEKILYTLVSGNGVSVSDTGLVTLTAFTNAQVKVYASESNVFVDFNINYKEKALQKISIKDFVLPKGALIGQEVYYVEVFAHFNETSEQINNSEAVFTNNTPTLYNIDKNGKITANNEYGTASLTVTFRDKTATYEWIIAPNITRLVFELNNANDNLGIKGERVFGIYSFKETNPKSFPLTAEEKNIMLNKVYQMKLTTNSETFNAPLIWTSSDTTVATVDNLGNITRLKAGKTTITCKPKYQATDTNTASYTFKFVDAVDVYNINQFEAYLTYGTSFNQQITDSASMADRKMTDLFANQNHLAVALHTDIIYTKDYTANFDPDPKTSGMFRAFRPISSLYGNGHTINASNCTPTKYDSPRTFQLFESNVLIDNVTIIGLKYKNENKPNLADFNGKAPAITIRAVGYPQKTLNGVVIANSTLMNGQSVIETYSSNFTLTGCELKNSFLSLVTLNCFGSTGIRSQVTAKNCIFRNGLAGAIDLKVDKENLTEKSGNIVNIVGNFYLDNWRNKKEIPNSLTSGNIDISTLIKSLYNDLEKDYPGMFVDGRINIGITKMQLLKKPLSLFNFVNHGKVNISLPYIDVIKYHRPNHVMGDASLDVYATPKNNSTILPGMTEPLRPGAQITSAVYPFIRDLEV